MTKTIRLLISFYSSFFLLNALVTLSCLLLFLEYGHSILTTLWCFKLATLVLVMYFINIYKRKQFYYYYNLGLTKTFLWTRTLGFDLALFILLLILVNTFR